jgi:hypothetical protein
MLTNWKKGDDGELAGGETIATLVAPLDIAVGNVQDTSCACQPSLRKPASEKLPNFRQGSCL